MGDFNLDPLKIDQHKEPNLFYKFKIVRNCLYTPCIYECMACKWTNKYKSKRNLI